MPSFLPEVCVVLPQAVPPSICEEIIDIGTPERLNAARKTISL